MALCLQILKILQRLLFSSLFYCQKTEGAINVPSYYLGGIFISKLNELKHISVLNYNENSVYITIAPKRSVKVEPAYDGEPSTLPLTLDEIKYVNNTSVFKSGVLEFQPDLEDDLYNELRIDRDKVLKLHEIRNILLNPTKDGLTKIISITSLADFDRVRGQFQKLKNEGYRLTLDVAEIIEKRTKELFSGKTTSNFLIEKVNTETENIKRMNELEKQLEEMKIMLAQALQSKSETPVINTPAENETKKTVKRSQGRPKKILEQ